MALAPKRRIYSLNSRKETYLFAGAQNNRTRFSKRNQNDDSFVCHILQIVQNKFERFGGEIVEWLVQQDHFSMGNHFNCNSNFSTSKFFHTESECVAHHEVDEYIHFEYQTTSIHSTNDPNA